MKLWQKSLIGIAGLVVVLGLVGWIFRTDLLLWAVSLKDNGPIAEETMALDWHVSAGPPPATSGDRPPNIVLILADDLGVNDISTFGGGVAGGLVPTPNIDRIARDGVNFTQGYAGNATCAPSRAMLMSGRYPTRTGFEFTPTPDNMARVVTTVNEDIRPDLPPIEYDAQANHDAPPFAEQGLPASEITIAELLKARGYSTMHIGKWHMGEAREFDALTQGFDHSLVLSELGYLPKDDPRVVNAPVDFDPVDRFLWARARFGNRFDRSQAFTPGGYLTDYWTDEALSAIDANKDRPFFLYLAHWAVHSPLQATREDYEAVGDIQPHRLRVYAAMVRALDRSVGRIIDKLEEEGLADNTLVLFSSDNGAPGYIGLPDVNAPYRGWKITLFEGGVRVPLMMRWPAQLPAGRQVRDPATHVDLFSTIAAAAGATLPGDRPIDGVDLLPVAKGDGPLKRPDGAIFWQSGTISAVRAGDWKLMTDDVRKKAWLYDLSNDPTERVNLIGKRPEQEKRLRTMLAAHHRNRKPPLYPSVVKMPVMIDKTLADTYEDGDEYTYWAN